MCVNTGTEKKSNFQSLEERQALQILLEEILEGLWRKLHEAAVAHKSATEEKRRVYQVIFFADICQTVSNSL